MPPIRPQATNSVESGRGDATGQPMAAVTSADHEIHAAGELDEAELDDEDIFEKEDPEHLGDGEMIEIVPSDNEEDSEPRRVAPDPGQPSAEEEAEHRIDHFPYRSWCRHCVEGRGTGEQHKAGPEGSIPIISADYLIVTKKGIFRKDEAESKTEIVAKILVVKDSKSKMVNAHVVPVKGMGEDRYAVEKTP